MGTEFQYLSQHKHQIAQKSTRDKNSNAHNMD